MNLQLPGGKGGREKQGVWDGHVYTTVFKTDNQEGPTVQHKNSAQYCVII